MRQTILINVSFFGWEGKLLLGDWTVFWLNCFWVFDDSLRFQRDLSVFFSPFSCIFSCSLSWQNSWIYFMLENHVSLFFTFSLLFNVFQFYSESFFIFLQFFIFCQAFRCFSVLFCRFNIFFCRFQGFL